MAKRPIIGHKVFRRQSGLVIVAIADFKDYSIPGWRYKGVMFVIRPELIASHEVQHIVEYKFLTKTTNRSFRSLPFSMIVVREKSWDFGKWKESKSAAIDRAKKLGGLN